MELHITIGSVISAEEEDKRKHKAAALCMTTLPLSLPLSPPHTHQLYVRHPLKRLDARLHQRRAIGVEAETVNEGLRGGRGRREWGRGGSLQSWHPALIPCSFASDLSPLTCTCLRFTSCTPHPLSPQPPSPHLHVLALHILRIRCLARIAGPLRHLCRGVGECEWGVTKGQA